MLGPAAGNRKVIFRRTRMEKKHYSGKELLYRRQTEKQRQQGKENTIRKWVQDVNQLKKSVETARQDAGERAKEGKNNEDGGI